MHKAIKVYFYLAISHLARAESQSDGKSRSDVGRASFSTSL